MPSQRCIHQYHQRQCPHRRHRITYLYQFQRCTRSFSTSSKRLSLQLTYDRHTKLLQRTLHHNHDRKHSTRSTRHRSQGIRHTQYTTFNQEIRYNTSTPHNHQYIQVQLLPTEPPTIRIQMSMLYFPQQSIRLPSKQFRRQHLPILTCRYTSRRYHKPSHRRRLWCQQLLNIIPLYRRLQRFLEASQLQNVPTLQPSLGGRSRL